MLTKRRLMGGGIAVVALVVIYFGLSWYIVGQALNAEASDFEHQPGDLGLTFEEVEFSPRGDGDIVLRGWWFPGDDVAATIIWVHGLDKNRAERLPLVKDLFDQGFAVLVFDLRGHGESDDVPIGAGYFETRDVRGAIDFLLAEKGVEPGKLLLMGQSFGAAAVLMAGVDEPAVAGVYADSAFAALTDVMIKEIKDRTPFPGWFAKLLRPGIVLVGEQLEGVKIDAVRPQESAGQYEYRLGLAHCRGDERIPFDHAARIRTASPPGSWFTVYPGCAHADAYDEFPEQYVAIVTNYFHERLNIEPE